MADVPIKIPKKPLRLTRWVFFSCAVLIGASQLYHGLIDLPQSSAERLVVGIDCHYTGSAFHKRAAAMSLRTRIKHEVSFGQRLANEAQRARKIAVTLPPGKKRDAFLEKARLADLAAHMNGWLTSPELTPPK